MSSSSSLPSQADVVVIGAGLAGLSAARRLHRSGRHVVVLEAGDAAGGRVRTDVVDGLLLDRGFQLFNSSYPQAAKVFDIEALELAPFRAGVVVSLGGARHIVGDPLRWPASLRSTLTAPIGSIPAKLAFAAWAAEVGFGPVSRIKTGTDRTLLEQLQRRRIDGRLTDTVLRPFLAGVLADDELVTSSRLGELLLRAFVRGTPSLPATGMRALPDQLVAGLGADVLFLNTAVTAVSAGLGVNTSQGQIRTRKVLVAADPRRACIMTSLPVPTMRSLTTFYHVSAESPTKLGALHVDGDARGPVVNTAVVSNVAPSYADGRSLIATTVLGHDDSQAMQDRARYQAGIIYGCDTASWEHVASYAIADALPAMAPPLNIRQPIDLGDGIYIAGDHRDTASIQGALASGQRAADAILSS